MRTDCKHYGNCDKAGTSDCCNANIIWSDICSDCKEHCSDACEECEDFEKEKK